MEIIIAILIIAFIGYLIENHKTKSESFLEEIKRERKELESIVRARDVEIVETLSKISNYEALEKFKPESRKRYEKHLSSDQFAQLKRDRLIIDNFKCQMCSTNVDLSTSHCHHITYLRLGKESLSDVSTLCKECHEKLHDFHGKNVGHYPLVSEKSLAKAGLWV